MLGELGGYGLDCLFLQAHQDLIFMLAIH